MLVMTHKAGDKIHISDNIVLEIVECSGGRVKIGYNAPRDVAILRDKVKEREHPVQDE